VVGAVLGGDGEDVEAEVELEIVDLHRGAPLLSAT
jgi:hypothetical protein